MQNKKGKAFQHLGIKKTICTKEYCEDKICDTPCETIKESLDVGHGTHDGSLEEAKFIAKTDFVGDTKAQYGIFYEPPIIESSTGQNIDVAKTQELQNNTEMRDNIHLNSSRNPAKIPENQGNNDPENIN